MEYKKVIKKVLIKIIPNTGKILGLLIYLCPSYTFAFQFHPSVSVFDAEGKGKTQSFQIYNSQGEDVAVEIRAYTRASDIHGKETYALSDEFLFFPRQFALKAGERRVIKATYTGKVDKKVCEKPYRIVAEQLSVSMQTPVENSGVNTQINFLYKYQTSSYVRSCPSKPNVVITNFSEGDKPLASSLDKKVTKPEKKLAKPETRKTERTLLVEFENKGNGHQVFHDWSLIMNLKGGETLTIRSTEDKTLPAFNILAENKRILEIPWPKKLKMLPEKVSYVVNN